MDDSIDLDQLLVPLEKLLRQVGAELILDWQAGKTDVAAVQVTRKADATPLTQADLKANAALVQGLQRILPECPIISEEAPCAAWSDRSNWQHCWLIDPLDGTASFIRGSSHFTINVALISQGRSVLGALYAPCSGQFYYATAHSSAFMKSSQSAVPQHLNSKKFNSADITLVVGEASLRSATRLVRYGRSQGWNLMGVGSALKLAYMAAGKGDFYPRRGAIYEWDIAAGQCILEQAGGRVVDLHGRSLRYNQAEDLVLPAFVAISDASAVEHVLNLIQEVYQDE